MGPFKNWASNEPENVNNQQKKDCTVLSATDYKWTSVDCNSQHDVICKLRENVLVLATPNFMRLYLYWLHYI